MSDPTHEGPAGYESGSIAREMGKGALLAAIAITAPIIFILAIKFVGSFLPPESKEAQDPTPDSFSMIIETVERKTA
ncbi:MAG: RC-LH1 core complex protein PufX [Pseudomonadota bacterium]